MNVEPTPKLLKNISTLLELLSVSLTLIDVDADWIISFQIIYPLPGSPDCELVFAK